MANNASVEAFLLKNVGSPVKIKKIKLDPARFKAEWEIRSLSAEEANALRKQATRPVINKDTHMTELQTDEDLFTGLMLAKSITFPDLENAELQMSWSCPGDPAKLLRTMLSVGDYQKLQQAVLDLSDLNNNYPDDLKETVKN